MGQSLTPATAQLLLSFSSHMLATLQGRACVGFTGLVNCAVGRGSQWLLRSAALGRSHKQCTSLCHSPAVAVAVPELRKRKVRLHAQGFSLQDKRSGAYGVLLCSAMLWKAACQWLWLLCGFELRQAVLSKCPDGQLPAAGMAAPRSSHAMGQ